MRRHDDSHEDDSLPTTRCVSKGLRKFSSLFALLMLFHLVDVRPKLNIDLCSGVTIHDRSLDRSLEPARISTSDETVVSGSEL